MKGHEKKLMQNERNTHANEMNMKGNECTLE
jgi:hypothetical protein